MSLSVLSVYVVMTCLMVLSYVPYVWLIKNDIIQFITLSRCRRLPLPILFNICLQLQLKACNPFHWIQGLCILFFGFHLGDFIIHVTALPATCIRYTPSSRYNKKYIFDQFKYRYLNQYFRNHWGCENILRSLEDHD